MKENNASQEAFYRKFKTQLETTVHFPSIYTYKFIVPNSTDASSRIKEIFDTTGAVISARPSAKGTYSSITISVMMESADDVIAKYRSVGSIDGVVML
jgi:putative lipoic acid-binding regulatory protein